MLTSEQFNESIEGRRQKKTQQKHTMRTPHKLRQPRNSSDDLRDICSFFFAWTNCSFYILKMLC